MAGERTENRGYHSIWSNYHFFALFFYPVTITSVEVVTPVRHDAEANFCNFYVYVFTDTYVCFVHPLASIEEVACS